MSGLAKHLRDGALLPLVCHHHTPARLIESVQVQLLNADASSIRLEFSVRGRSNLLLPKEAAPVRTDGLWRTTCFEAFLRAGEDKAYVELNFSPSNAWAAYRFEAYRYEMSDFEPRIAPEIICYESERELNYFSLSAEFDVAHYLNGPFRMGLSAVVEETDGTKSFWALRHPSGPPDFHHPDCFALEVPALGAP